MGRENHIFNLDGGEDLTTIGASWFVSYSYYNYVDSNHNNWKKVSTFNNRQSVYRRSSRYHKYWLKEILKMNVENLNKNRLGLTGDVIKEMAEKVLAVM